MNRIFVRSMLIAVAATLFLSVVGGTGGYLLTRANTRQELQIKLAKDARQNGEVIASFLDESRTLLALLNHSPAPVCSDAEIDSFRQLIFHSQNLRDAGRIRDGRLLCSAMFGRKNLPATHYLPTITQPDGTRMYRNIEPYVSDKTSVFVLQQGDSYVVEDPNYNFRIQRQVNPNTEISMWDVVSHKFARPNGIPSPTPASVKVRDGQGNVGDLFYATRCTARDYMCSTAHDSLSQAIWEGHRSQLFASIALGSLSGVLIALILTLIRLRDQSLHRQLRRAIRQDKVRLVYQPIVNLANGKIVEAEALSRWTDEDGFAVSPEVFVRLAEERGFMNELTEMVVRQALRDFRELLRSDPDFRLNINVSASDLADPDFLPMLQRYLAEADVDAHHLAIELTESSTARKHLAVQAIRQLRARGHCVQLDDFGTGYSSLAYLRDLAVDAIKIDRSFTQAIGTESVIGAILPQILAMAQALDLQVIVEGIETAEQASYFAVQRLPILGQGWLFGHAVPADTFHAHLVVADHREETVERFA
jgi:sensor c-di-GMP phosphodiesterase-like protein